MLAIACRERYGCTISVLQSDNAGIVSKRFYESSDFLHSCTFISLLIIAVYLGDGTQLLRTTNRKSSVADRSVSVPMTLCNPERRDTRGPMFPAYLQSTLAPFDLEGPNSAW